MRRHAFALLALACFALPAAAQNLLVNPDLDLPDDLTGWPNDFNAGHEWSSDDADGCTDSGSLAGTTGEGSPGFQAYTTRNWTCVPVTPGETVYLSVAYRSQIEINRLYFSHCSDADCNTCVTFSAFLDAGGPTDSWATLHGSEVIPDGVGAVWLSINSSEVGTTPKTIGLDRAYVGRQDRIHVDGFENGSACHWVAIGI
jgi:hypothetical protein